MRHYLIPDFQLAQLKPTLNTGLKMANYYSEGEGKFQVQKCI